jgi:prepilin-type N-terminal cleavage/methylation domain-containing protein
MRIDSPRPFLYLSLMHCIRLPPTAKQAFSLVELSIVLVILGLLIGGILSGQSLIRAAELRAVSTEYARYFTSAQTFRDKYFALPGDMNNATAFWNTAASCPGTNTTPSSSALTCNGDGNGIIDISATSQEHFRFWQHLANAGLIEGSYTGVTDSASSPLFATLNKNVPGSKLSRAGWYALHGWGEVPAADTNLFEGSYGAIYLFGAPGGNYTEGPVLKAEEAWNIDTKSDDGKPGLGKIRIFERHTNCHDGGVQATPIATTANYALNSTISDACTLVINQ